MSCSVTVVNGTLPQEEINAYIARAREIYHREPESVNITVDGDEVELEYRFRKVPFNRLRRITGYLVGDLSRWNNGKFAEQNDRVKHAV